MCCCDYYGIRERHLFLEICSGGSFVLCALREIFAPYGVPTGGSEQLCCAKGNALKWRHVEKNRISFCEAMPTDIRILKDTKTHAPRYFPINEELRQLFEAVRPEDCRPDMLVFPGKNGKELHTHNFLNRVWKPIVERLVAAGKVRLYLPQYNCRHTFITLCLESGIPSRRVADWCGTSVAVIEEHYAGAILK